MRHFIERHAEQIVGVLSGWDRLRLRGTLRWLANVDGMRNYLWHAQVLLKDFKRHALEVTGQIRQATERLAAAAGRPVIYLRSSATNKEAEAQRIAARDGITEGLVCVLSCVELGWSYEVGPNRDRQQLELRGGPRKCLHYYFYLIDRRLGWMHLRLETWFPFTLHVCVNGREWLARQLDAAGIGYRRRDNCLVDVADPRRAQRFLDRQLEMDWQALLSGLVRRVETTINDARDMKVYRAKEGPAGDVPKTRAPRRLRKGVADLPRRAEISQAANERYLDALAAAEATTPLGKLAERVGRPAYWQGRRVRALNPLAPDDSQLLSAIARGEFTINGFRNRDLRPILFGAASSDPQQLRRQSAAVTRNLRLLRGHGLIRKVPKTHRYVLTVQGTLIVNALMAAQKTDTNTLTKLAG